MYYYARELNEDGRILDAIEWFNQFLESGQEWMEDNIDVCGELSKCYQAENKRKGALSAMLYSFRYDIPRAEICCQLGYHFKMERNYKQAAFWFDLALKLEKPKENWRFQQEDCWGYIPCIECAVCYDNLGNYEKAVYYNKKLKNINRTLH